MTDVESGQVSAVDDRSPLGGLSLVVVQKARSEIQGRRREVQPLGRPLARPRERQASSGSRAGNKKADFQGGDEINIRKQH